MWWGRFFKTWHYIDKISVRYDNELGKRNSAKFDTYQNVSIYIYQYINLFSRVEILLNAVCGLSNKTKFSAKFVVRTVLQYLLMQRVTAFANGIRH